MKRQRGAAMVEFAIIALLFFVVLFSVIEMGRWMFNWNLLNEATRRGARIAAVCPPNDPYIAVAAVFGDTARPDDAQNSPILNGLDTGDVTVAYYRINASGNMVQVDPSSASVTDIAQIKLVEVTINYNHRFIAPIVGDILGNIVAPAFRTLLPVESFNSDVQKSPNLCF
ncbi:MAG: TadE/TadG family type IV pilus assembly protein [Gammaproteobacteria bacterium]